MSSPALPDAAASARGRGRRLLPILLALAALVQPMASGLARWDWRADLLSHFEGPAFGISLLAALALVRRHRRSAAAFALLAAFQFWPLIRYSGPNPVPPDPDSGPRLRIL